MCRFIAYLGAPVIAEDLLIKPKNSLLNQSINAQESEMHVNGDGFGMGWYQKSIRNEPALYKSIRPAWNDPNLRYNAGIIKTNCLLAHVRAATAGSISYANTHPFVFREYLMMQNGGIKEFAQIKKKLIARLDDKMFDWIKGQTDTEYIFALFGTVLRNRAQLKEVDLDDIADSFSETFSIIEDLKQAEKLDSPSLYNMVFTDGKSMIATRYSSHPDLETRSLHIASGVRFYINESGKIDFEEATTHGHSVLISSEVLSSERGYWETVPENHAVLVNEELEAKIKRLI